MKLFKYCLVLLLFSVPFLGHASPHLMLYFDVNKTLIASDRDGQKTTEDVLNELLAAKYVANWDDTLAAPLSFEEYVYQVLIPGRKEDPALKQARQSYLQHFTNYLQRTDHPLYPHVKADYEHAISILDASPSIVFTSFYRLMDRLDCEHISYTIVLRSFGSEIFELADEISILSDLKFENGSFKNDVLTFKRGDVLSDPMGTYKHLRLAGHTAVRDDWNYWSQHEMRGAYGKPFYIDRDDCETLSIFFDDNISSDSVTNIIVPIDVHSGHQIPVSELIQAGQAVQVDTLEAILDVDYFWHCVQQAILKKPEMAF